MPTQSFRDFLFPADDPRINSLKPVAAPDYLEAAKKDSFAGPMIETWAKLYPEPFVGVTNDGQIRPNLFVLRDVSEAYAAPTDSMVAAARHFLDSLDPDEVQAVSYPLDSHEWRTWANPEFTQFPTGLRLENLDIESRDAALAVIEASMSSSGYRLARDLMLVNAFLGAEVGLPQLMNEYSYQFAIYGEPSLREPWGWNLFGHHVALNCLVVGGQMVLSPVFLGGEPSLIDEGPYAGTRLFEDRIDDARSLMNVLADDVRERAITYQQMVDPAMPPGRVHPGDERHLAGCFQDNRVIPNEGLLSSELGESGLAYLRQLIRSFVSILPEGPCETRIDEIEAHLDETWFSWIGGWGPSDPFYFRIQSPVVILELDHHCGVFLSNREPAQFHIHTVMRTPNGNDYGRVLVEQKLGRQLTA